MGQKQFNLPTTKVEKPGNSLLWARVLTGFYVVSSEENYVKTKGCSGLAQQSLKSRLKDIKMTTTEPSFKTT